MARCVHCLNPAGDTRDHAFPASWYPESTPGEVQRPTAPCCGPCNRGFGKLEGYLLGRIGLCLDPRNAESAGIPAKALRSVGIGLDSELTKREKRIRARLKAKLMSDTKPYREVAGKPGILPGFGPHIGFPVESQLAISVNAGDLKKVCRKIICGLEYHLAGRYIESPYELDVFFIEAQTAEELAGRFGSPSLHLGPGFEVQRTAASDDPGLVLYRIKVWGQLLVHGSIVISRKPRQPQLLQR